MAQRARRSLLAFPASVLGALQPSIVTAPAHGQCMYDVLVIEPECGSAGVFWTQANALNDLAHGVGVVACGFGDTAVSFFWDGVDLGPIQFPWPIVGASANDLTNEGAIVGSVDTQTGPPSAEAFLHLGNRVITLGIPEGGSYSHGHAINSMGVAVGRWGNPVTGPGVSAFVWADGVMTDLGPLLSQESSRAEDINAAGAIVGRIGGSSDAQAFLIDAGGVTILPDIPGGISSEASALNAFKHVVGSGIIIFEPGNVIVHPFLWIKGKFLDLGLLPGMLRGGATDINDAGQIVGVCESNVDMRAFFWQDGVMHDLNDFIPPERAIHVIRTRAINNAGQVLADAADLTTGELVVVLLSPLSPQVGDINCDGAVDAVDLSVLLTLWGEPVNSSADFDMDGTVGPFDLAILLSHWLQCK